MRGDPKRRDMMATTREHKDLLAGTTLFSGLSARSLETIASLAREVAHDAGHVVVSEGSTAHALHVIIEGTAEVSIGGTPVAEIGPGDSFGEVALLDSGPRTATVSAKTPMRILAVDGYGFKTLLQKDADLAYGLIQHLASLVRELDEQLRP
ncbi:MAG: cyclic nucleotide-binding domain-containing protein [Actinobacteria bacterium]|nr:cyclic nucleotide-binding domain-containing protein [Actinomycetota bacterium]